MLPLEVFLRIADSAMWPLVILHTPKTEELCAKKQEAAEIKTKKWQSEQVGWWRSWKLRIFHSCTRIG